MLSSLKKTVSLIDPRSRRRWLGLVVLGSLVSALEAVGAVLVFLVVTLVTGDEDRFSMPLIGDLRDRFPGTSDTRLFAYVALFIGVFFVCRSLVFVFQTYAQNRTAHLAGVALSRRLLAGYLNAPYPWHLQRNSSELIRNAYESVTVLVQNVLIPAVVTLSEAFVVLGMLAVLLAQAPLPTAGAIAVMGALIFIILRVLQPRLARLGTDYQTASARSLHMLQESLGAVRDIKLLHTEQTFLDRFNLSRRQQARAHIVRGTLLVVPRLVIETSAILLILVFLGLTRGDERTDGEPLALLGLFAYAVLRIMPAVNRIIGNVNTMKYGTQVVDDLQRDVAEADAQRPSQPAAAEWTFQRSIHFRGVSFRYQSDSGMVLSGIDLTIAFGESVGLVGPTGGGKSTLVDLATGLLRPAEGEVLIDNRPLDDSMVPGWQAQIGIVSQTVFLLDDTLRRNIAFGIPDDEINPSALAEATSLAQLDPFLESLPAGLDTTVGERGVRLSGGQRQRVGIARALYRRPRVLVFDEGTSALDSVTEAQFIRALEELRGGRTIVTIAHRLTTVKRCDRIVMLKAGRILDIGTFEELLARSVEFRELAG